MASKGKFAAPKHPLLVEQTLKKIQPIGAYKDAIKEAYFLKSMYNESEADIQAAWANQLVKFEAQQLDDKIDSEFKNDFRAWVCGNSPFNANAKITPWGRKPLFYVNQGVRDFLTAEHDMHHDFRAALIKLQFEGPGKTIEQAYLYYKYIVRALDWYYKHKAKGETAHPPWYDHNGQIEFLDMYSMLQNPDGESESLDEAGQVRKGNNKQQFHYKRELQDILKQYHKIIARGSVTGENLESLIDAFDAVAIVEPEVPEPPESDNASPSTSPRPPTNPSLSTDNESESDTESDTESETETESESETETDESDEDSDRTYDDDSQGYVSAESDYSDDDDDNENDDTSPPVPERTPEMPLPSPPLPPRPTDQQLAIIANQIEPDTQDADLTIDSPLLTNMIVDADDASMNSVIINVALNSSNGPVTPELISATREDIEARALQNYINNYSAVISTANRYEFEVNYQKQKVSNAFFKSTIENISKQKQALINASNANEFDSLRSTAYQKTIEETNNSIAYFSDEMAALLNKANGDLTDEEKQEIAQNLRMVIAQTRKGLENISKKQAAIHNQTYDPIDLTQETTEIETTQTAFVEAVIQSVNRQTEPDLMIITQAIDSMNQESEDLEPPTQIPTTTATPDNPDYGTSSLDTTTPEPGDITSASTPTPPEPIQNATTPITPTTRSTSSVSVKKNVLNQKLHNLKAYIKAIDEKNIDDDNTVTTIERLVYEMLIDVEDIKSSSKNENTQKTADKIKQYLLKVQDDYVSTVRVVKTGNTYMVTSAAADQPEMTAAIAEVQNATQMINNNIFKDNKEIEAFFNSLKHPPSYQPPDTNSLGKLTLNEKEEIVQKINKKFKEILEEEAKIITEANGFTPDQKAKLIDALKQIWTEEAEKANNRSPFKELAYPEDLTTIIDAIIAENGANIDTLIVKRIPKGTYFKEQQLLTIKRQLRQWKIYRAYVPRLYTQHWLPQEGIITTDLTTRLEALDSMFKGRETAVKQLGIQWIKASNRYDALEKEYIDIKKPRIENGVEVVNTNYGTFQWVNYWMQFTYQNLVRLNPEKAARGLTAVIKNINEERAFANKIRNDPQEKRYVEFIDKWTDLVFHDVITALTTANETNRLFRTGKGNLPTFILGDNGLIYDVKYFREDGRVKPITQIEPPDLEKEIVQAKETIKKKGVREIPVINIISYNTTTGGFNEKDSVQDERLEQSLRAALSRRLVYDPSKEYVPPKDKKDWEPPQDIIDQSGMLPQDIWDDIKQSMRDKPIIPSSKRGITGNQASKFIMELKPGELHKRGIKKIGEAFRQGIIPQEWMGAIVLQPAYFRNKEKPTVDNYPMPYNGAFHELYDRVVQNRIEIMKKKNPTDPEYIQAQKDIVDFGEQFYNNTRAMQQALEMSDNVIDSFTDEYSPPSEIRSTDWMGLPLSLPTGTMVNILANLEPSTVEVLLLRATASRNYVATAGGYTEVVQTLVSIGNVDDRLVVALFLAMALDERAGKIQPGTFGSLYSYAAQNGLFKTARRIHMSRIANITDIPYSDTFKKQAASLVKTKKFPKGYLLGSGSALPTPILNNRQAYGQTFRPENEPSRSRGQRDSSSGVRFSTKTTPYQPKALLRPMPKAPLIPRSPPTVLPQDKRGWNKAPTRQNRDQQQPQPWHRIGNFVVRTNKDQPQNPATNRLVRR